VLPLKRVIIRILFQCLFRQIIESLYHHLLDIHQPVLDRAFREHTSREFYFFWHGFGLGRNHRDNLFGLLDIGELDAVDIVETFTEMTLDCMRISCL
jgi:hypothetical protein